MFLLQKNIQCSTRYHHVLATVIQIHDRIYILEDKTKKKGSKRYKGKGLPVCFKGKGTTKIMKSESVQMATCFATAPLGALKQIKTKGKEN